MGVSRDAYPDTERGVEQDIANSEPVADSSLVNFDGSNDPDNANNWSSKRRWGITISMGLMVFTVTFASSIFSVNIGVMAQKFDVDLVTATLGVALFFLVGSTISGLNLSANDHFIGFVFGPVIFGLRQKSLVANLPFSLALRYSLFSKFQLHSLRTSQVFVLTASLTASLPQLLLQLWGSAR